MAVKSLKVERRIRYQFLLFSLSWGLLFISKVNAQPAPISPLEQQREALARDALAKDPMSETARLKLGYILFEQKRYDEAKSEAAQVLKANPENSSAKILEKQIEISTSNLSDQEKAKALFGTFEQSLEPLKNLEKDLNLDSLREEGRQRKAALDLKYGISRYRYPASTRPVTSSKRKLVNELKLARKESEAIRLSQEELNEFPDSVDTRVDHVQLLIDFSKLDEAEKTTKAGLEMYPDHPMLKILLDGISEIKSRASTETQESAKRDLQFRLLDAFSIRSDLIMAEFRKKNGN